MKKRKYTQPEIELYKFNFSNLIMASSEDANQIGDDSGGDSLWAAEDPE